jgi:hypothetical protein
MLQVRVPHSDSVNPTSGFGDIGPEPVLTPDPDHVPDIIGDLFGPRFRHRSHRGELETDPRGIAARVGVKGLSVYTALIIPSVLRLWGRRVTNICKPTNISLGVASTEGGPIGGE